MTDFSGVHVNVSGTNMIDGHWRPLIRVIRMRKRIRKGLIVQLSAPLTTPTDGSADSVCAFLESKIRRPRTCSPASIQPAAIVEKAQWHDSTPMQMSVPLLLRVSKTRSATFCIVRARMERRFYANRRGTSIRCDITGSSFPFFHSLFSPDAPSTTIFISLSRISFSSFSFWLIVE